MQYFNINRAKRTRSRSVNVTPAKSRPLRSLPSVTLMLALMGEKKMKPFAVYKNVTLLRTFRSAQTSKRAQLTESGESADGLRREGKTRPPVCCGFCSEEISNSRSKLEAHFPRKHAQNTRAHTRIQWRSAAANVHWNQPPS